MVYIVPVGYDNAIMFGVQFSVIHKSKTPRISVNGGRRWLTLQGIKFQFVRGHTRLLPQR